jgi:hypothetical protein
LPGDETYPKVMRRTADFHNQIVDACLPQAARIVNDAAVLDAAVGVLDADARACDATIGGFLGTRESPSPRLLGGHDDLDLVEREHHKAEALEQSAACGQGVGRSIRTPLVVDTARPISQLFAMFHAPVKHVSKQIYLIRKPGAQRNSGLFMASTLNRTLWRVPAVQLGASRSLFLRIGPPTANGVSTLELRWRQV